MRRPIDKKNAGKRKAGLACELKVSPSLDTVGLTYLNKLLDTRSEEENPSDESGDGELD